MYFIGKLLVGNIDEIIILILKKYLKSKYGKQM